MKLRELEKEFVRKGVRYTQIDKNTSLSRETDGKYRTDGYVIYECSNLSYKDVYYEVFRYKIAKPHPHDDGDWDMVEVYPSDEQFGITAFCCSNEASLRKVMKKEFGIDYDIVNK